MAWQPPRARRGAKPALRRLGCDMRNRLVATEIARLAARQHGVVSTKQLAEAGIDRGAAARRARTGTLHRLFRGVYAVGHQGISQEGTWTAAVLACGEGAVLSHSAADALWRLLPPTQGWIDVTVPSNGGRPNRSGIRRHCSRTLTSSHATRRKNIPVTTPARTIADLRRVVPATVAASRSAGSGRRPRHSRRSQGRRDPQRAGREVPATLPPALPPAPEVNAKVGQFVVDFLWRERSLIVETDGYRYHRGR